MADFRDWAHLARLMLISLASGVPRSGRMTMEKFETFAFAIGFIVTGLLTVVAQVQLV